MIQLLEDLGAEFERVAAETPRRPRRRRFLALFAAVLVGTGAYAVPATRAGIDELAGWLTGGRAPAPGEHVPDSIRAEGNPRLVARSGDARLYVSRKDGYINVASATGSAKAPRSRTGASASPVTPSSCSGRPRSEASRGTAGGASR